MRKLVRVGLAAIGAFCLWGCFNPDKYNDIKPKGIIAFTTGDGTTVPADGSSSFSVTVQISKDAVAAKRNVVFKTTLGSFKGGTADSIVVAVDTNFNATAKLVSLNMGPAVVSAKILGVTASGGPKVTFSPAYADSVKVAVDSFSIRNNFKSEVVVTASLKSGKGKPTIGQVVNFSVVDAAGNPVGTFLNGIATGTSDMAGQVQLRYSAGNTAYMGWLTIRAAAVSGSAPPVSGTTQIYLDH